MAATVNLDEARGAPPKQEMAVGAGRTAFALSLGAAILLCLSVTHQTLWIDEAVTAWFASQRTFSDVIAAIVHAHGTEAQTPLYVVYIWTWAQVFGTGEYALRAANIPSALILVATLSWTSYHVFRRPAVWVVACLAPFLVFYMNEARAYVTLVACAAVSTAAVLAYFADRTRYGRTAPWLCLVALVVACAMNVLGAFLVPSLAIYAALTIRAEKIDFKAVLRDWRTPLLLTVPLLLVLGAYIAWTVFGGPSISARYATLITLGLPGGVRGHPGPANFAFAMWEFAGLGGLGPPRIVLRADPSLHTVAPYWRGVTLGILACVAALATLFPAASARAERRTSWHLLVGLVVGIALFIVVARVVRFEFWGRHLAGFFPGFAFVVILLTQDSEGPRWLRVRQGAAFALLAVVWLISDARLIADSRYFKDDYRSAASLALEARRTGSNVVWAAEAVGARYYGIDLNELGPDVDWPVKATAVYGRNWTDEQIAAYVASGVRTGQVILVLNRPDVNDSKGAWAAAVRRMHAREIASPNGFAIYAFR